MNGMEAIAPPVAAPVRMGVSPDVAQSADANIAPPARNLSDMYEDAASSGDPSAMRSLVQRAKGTEYEPVVERSAQVMQRNADQVSNIATPIVEAGGLESPRGRLVATAAFKTVADDPQKGRAFVEMLMGNPKWRTFVTGGTPTTVVGFDSAGKQLEKTVNELGQIVSVVDSETGEPIDRNQLSQRGGFLNSLDNALGFQAKKEISKFNTEAFNKSSAATKDFAARAPELKGLYSEMRQRLVNLGTADLTEDQRRAIGQFTERSMGISQTMSQGLSALQQKMDQKDVNLSRSEQKALDAVMQKFGLRIGPSGSVVNKNGESVSKSELGQMQNSLSNGSEFDRNFRQSKEDFLRSELFKNLGGAEMKNLGRILDLQGSIERSLMEVSSKHGTLPFVINPKGYQLGDEFSRGEASALIGEFNQDVTTAYNRWRDQKVEAYRRNGDVPSAGELEAAFVNTDIYKDLKQRYADENRAILRRPDYRGPSSQKPVSEQWSIDLGVSPKEPKTEMPKAKAEKGSSSAPSGYERVGTTPQGKAVFRTPEGKTVVER